MANVKGTQMLDLVKSLRAERELACGILPDELHRYLNTRILPSSWYPEKDYHQLLRALVQVMPEVGMEPWEFIGDFGARSQFSNVYQPLIREGRPADSLERYATVWRLSHDSGKVECAIGGDDKARVWIRDYSFGHQDYTRCVGAFLRRIVLLAGASEAEYRILGSGWDSGWEVSWTA